MTATPTAGQSAIDTYELSFNGGTFEECYTNIFSMTELQALKWRCYTSPSNIGHTNIDSDPIFRAYRLCKKANLVVTWRRQPKNPTGMEQLSLPQFMMDSNKELYVFWYGEEPGELKDITQGLQGKDETGDSQNGISYDVRVLYFKALNTLIQRRLMRGGIVRFGRWFVRPLHKTQVTRKETYTGSHISYTLAWTFHHFVHGGNLLCTTVQVQRQPTLFQLTPEHLKHAPFPVIVGPWSFRATLLPQDTPCQSSPLQNEWDLWRDFFDISDEDDQMEEPGGSTNLGPETAKTTDGPLPSEPLPKFLPLEWDGVRMLYPAKFVAVLEEDDPVVHRKWEAPRAENSPIYKAQELRIAKEQGGGLRSFVHARNATFTRIVQSMIQDSALVGARIIGPSLPPVLSSGLPYGAPGTMAGPRFDAQGRPTIDQATGLMGLEEAWSLNPSFHLKDAVRCECAVCRAEGPAVIPNRLAIDAPQPPPPDPVTPKLEAPDIILPETSPVDPPQPPPPPPNTATPSGQLYQTDVFNENTITAFTTHRRARQSLSMVPGFMTALPEKSIIKIDKYHVTGGKAKHYAEDEKRIAEIVDFEGECVEGHEWVEHEEVGPDGHEFGVIREDSDSDDGIPAWAQVFQSASTSTSTSKGKRGSNNKTNILCTADEAVYHYQEKHPGSISSSPGGSSDGERLAESPFTPVTMMSPCHDCEWPSAPLDELPETVFNIVFRPKPNTKVAASTSREEKARDWSCFYNPTLRDTPIYKNYHSRRTTRRRRGASANAEKFRSGEKRKPTYPIDVRPPATPDEAPGSQDTLQASSSVKNSVGASNNSNCSTVSSGTSANGNVPEEAKKSYPKLRDLMAQSSTLMALVMAEDEEFIPATNSPTAPPEPQDPAGPPDLKPTISKARNAIVSAGYNSDDDDRRLLRKVTPMRKEASVWPEIYNPSDDRPASRSSNTDSIPTVRALDSALSPLDRHAGLSDTDSDFGENFDSSSSSSSSEDEEGESESQPRNSSSTKNDSGEMRAEDLMEYGTTSGSFEHRDEDMDVDSAGYPPTTSSMPWTTDSVLSPPASNERVDHTLIVPPHLLRGPPSVGDAMNQIYPTPPSVAEQQFSPIGVTLITAAPTTPAMATALPGYSISVDEPMMEMEQPRDVKKEPPELFQFNHKKSKSFFDLDDVIERRRKFDVPESQRFTEVHAVSVLPKAFELPDYRNRKDEKRPESPTDRKASSSKSAGIYGRDVSTFTAATGYIEQSIGQPPQFHSMMPSQMANMGMMSQQQMYNQQMHHQQQQMQMRGMQQPLGYGHPSYGRMGPQGQFGGPPGMYGGRIPPSYGDQQQPQYGPGGMGQNVAGMPSNMPGMNMQAMPGGGMSAMGSGMRAYPPGYAGAQGYGPQGYGSPAYPGQVMHGQGPQGPMYQNQMHQQQMMYPGQQQRPPGYPGAMGQMGGAQGMNSGGVFMDGAHGGPSGSGMDSYGRPQHPQVGPGGHQQQQYGMGIQSSGPYGQQMSQQRPGMNQAIMPSGGHIQGMSGGIQPTSGGPGAPMAGYSNPTQNTVARPFDARAEGRALIAAIVLQDTILDLHYDTVFDACPICACNQNIRGRELGVYITPPDLLRAPVTQQQQSISSFSGFHITDHMRTCTCGFSVVRYRYLSMKAGLFPEDEKEATAHEVTSPEEPTRALQHNLNMPSPQAWFDPTSRADMSLLDALRIMCLSRDISPQAAQTTLDAKELDRMLRRDDIGSDSCSPSSYILSPADAVELQLAGNSAIEMAMTHRGARNSTANQHSNLRFFHPWGLQVANHAQEASADEIRAVVSDIRHLVEDSIRIARRVDPKMTGTIVEGPLTWRQFTAKNARTEEEREKFAEEFQAEPIPFIMVSNEKDPVKVGPQLTSSWRDLNAGPIDQPKDVYYLVLLPDSPELISSARYYMRHLSETYEAMRLGKHLPWPRTVVGQQVKLSEGLLVGMPAPGEEYDGCIRIGAGRTPINQRHNLPSESMHLFFKSVEKFVKDRELYNKLYAYAARLEEQLYMLFKENDHLFERQAFRESMAVDARFKKIRLLQTEATIAVAAEKVYKNSRPREGEKGIPVGPGEEPERYSGAQILSASGSQQTQYGGIPTIPQTTATITSLQQQLELEDVPADDDPCALPQVIVLYLLNPFAFGVDCSDHLWNKVVIQALVRSFNCLSLRLPMKRRVQLQLEILNMNRILDFEMSLPYMAKEDNGYLPSFDQGQQEREMNEESESFMQLQEMALQVYSRARTVLVDAARSVVGKSMTRFGPAAQLNEMIDDIETKFSSYVYKIPCTPYHLAPPQSLVPVLLKNGEERVVPYIEANPQEEVLFVSYCLLGNEWLVVGVSDSIGRLQDTCAINLRAKSEPNKIYRYRSRTMILDALHRLWLYLIGVMSNDVRNWRLVIGRLGRIGHAEFRAWTFFLSKNNLKKFSQKLKDSCNTCSRVGPPSILSACLTSIEPEPYIRILSEYYNLSESAMKNAKAREAHSPDIVSCTHILVFPTSADIQLHSGEDKTEGQQENQEDDGDFFMGLDMGFEEDNELKDMMGLLNTEMDQSDVPPSAGPSSSGHLRSQHNVFFPDSFSEITMENQPLATGYYISGAPPGELPDWFWASSPSSRFSVPTHLRSSLHLNVPQVQQSDDIQIRKESTKKEETDSSEQVSVTHPLDSSRTDDVLRYVLETYNQLSWLNIDEAHRERRSCMPIHIQQMLRLYKTIQHLIM